MLTEIQVRKLFADAYFEAALSCKADMKVVTEALESIRNELSTGNPYNLWSRVNLSKQRSYEEHLKALFLNLKTQHQEVLFQSLRGYLQQEFEKSQSRGWKLWFHNYLEALICWNGDIYGRLCTEPFSFPDAALPVVDKLKRLNRLILESRWIDAYPILQMIIDHKLTKPEQRAYIVILSAEVDLFHLQKPEEALKKLQSVENLIGRSSNIKRAFAEYYQKSGDLESSRKHIFEAIVQDANNIENYLLMGDTYRDEGVADVAERWYRDAIQINFLKGEPYMQLLSIYGSPSKPEQENEISSLLATAESLDPDNDYNHLIYNGYREAGKYYSTNNKLSESIRYYERAIQLHPGWVTAYADLGYVLSLIKDFDSAQAKIEQALKIDPGYYDGLVALAWLEEQKSYDGPQEQKAESTRKAIEIYKQCASLRPSTAANIYNTIGVLYGDLNDFESSRQYYLKAIKADPASSLYQQNLAFAYNKLQDYASAREAYLRAIELGPGDPSTHNKLGNVYFTQKLFEEAKKCYITAIELSPEVAVYYENLGLANYELGNWEEAIAAYEKSASLTASWSIYNDLGNAYFQVNNYDNAIVNYRKAIELEPGKAILYDNIGLAYDKSGKAQDAEQAFLKAIEIEPDNYTFNNRLGVLYSQQRKYDAALPYFQKAVAFGKGEAVLFGNLALTYGSLEQWEKAEEAYLKAIDAEPGNSIYLNYLGVCFYRQKQFDDAIKYYKKAIKSNPNEPIYWENLGLAYEDGGLLSKAKTAYKKYIQLAPGIANSYFRMAVVLAKENNLPAALKIIKKGVLHEPGNVEALKIQGQYEEKLELFGDALTTYRHALTIVPDDETLNNRAGICCYRLRDNKNAIYYYRKAITSNSRVAIYYENLGLALEESGQFEEAEEAYKKSIEIEPETYTYQNRLGVFYFSRGRYQAAIEYYNKAITLNPAEVILFQNLGLAYDAMGDREKALETYQHALTLHPENDLLNNATGELLYKKGEYQKAIDYFLKAIETNPTFATYYHNTSIAYQALNNYQESRKALEKLLELDPGNASHLNSVGLTYYYEKDLAKAIDCYKQAIAINPNSEVYYENLGLAYEDMKDYENARITYEKVLPISPKKDRLLNLIGLMYYFENRFADAITYYTKAIELNSLEPVYWSNLALAYRYDGNLKEAERAATEAITLDASEIYVSRLSEIKQLAGESRVQNQGSY